MVRQSIFPDAPAFAEGSATASDGSRRCSIISAASSSARASPMETPPGPGSLSDLPQAASAKTAAIADSLFIAASSFDHPCFGMVPVQVFADDLQVAAVGTVDEVEQIAHHRHRAQHHVKADMAHHARQLPFGYTQIARFPHDVEAQHARYQIARHRHEAGNGIKAHLPVDAGDRQRAFEQAFQRFDPALYRKRIAPQRQIIDHAARLGLRSILLRHRAVLSFATSAAKPASPCYLGRMAIGIKGWTAQVFAAKPLMSPRTSDQRTGAPKGMNTFDRVSSTSASASSAALAEGSSAFRAALARASASALHRPRRARQDNWFKNQPGRR